MRLQVLRKERIPDGVFGELHVLADEFDLVPPAPLQLQTIEDDYRDNAPRISCIPSGLYTLQRTIFYKHGYETFEVVGVPNRSRILIHPANTEEDLEGCIGVGLRRGKIRVAKDEDTGELNVLKNAVVASREAFRQLMEVMAPVDNATLEVIWIGDLGPSPAMQL
jgi:hypothetical protein